MLALAILDVRWLISFILKAVVGGRVQLPTDPEGGSGKPSSAVYSQFQRFT